MTIPQFLEQLEANPTGTYRCSRLRNDGGLISAKTPDGWTPCFYFDADYCVDLARWGALCFPRSAHLMQWRRVRDGLSASRITLQLTSEARYHYLPPRVRKITAAQAKQIVADEIWASVVDDTSRREELRPSSSLAGQPTERHEQWWRAVNTEAICLTASQHTAAHGKLKVGAMNLARDVRSSFKTQLEKAESGQTETLQEIATMLQTFQQTLEKKLSQVRDLRSSTIGIDPRTLRMLTFGCLRASGSDGNFVVDKGYVDLPYRRSHQSIHVTLPEDSDLRFPSALPVVNGLWAHFGLPTVQPFGLEVNDENLTKLVVLADAARQQLLSFTPHQSPEPEPEPENKNESKPYEITI